MSGAREVVDTPPGGVGAPIRPDAQAGEAFRREESLGDGPWVLGDRASLERWSRIRAEDLHEVNRSELERIRSRIEKDGVGALTPSDREFLDRFSSRVAG